MDSLLVRTILATLCGFLLILLILLSFDWYKEEFPKPRSNASGKDRVHQAMVRKEAADALDRFSRLPGSEREKMLQRLGSIILPLEEWLSRLGRSDCEILCLGEFHEESTRQFLAEAFFDRFRTDVLLLEATPEALTRLLKKMEAGRRYFPLLGADMLNVLRAVQNRNPEIRIYGIEETADQEKENKGMDGSRDRSLAQNFWVHFQPGRCHVILIGSLHCTGEPNWLFGRLLREAPPALRQRMMNVQVVGENQSGPLQAFLFFLDRLGIATEESALVFADTGNFPLPLRRWFPALNRQSLERYPTLIVFRSAR
jgi:hypothetical protein